MFERGETRSGDGMSDIAYLARSSNRVEILATLVTGPYTTRELEAETGVARSTLERILSELQERGWAVRAPEGGYAATAAGTFAVREFAPLVDAMEALRRLDRAVAWLPREELSIGLHHFSDAVVRGPESNSVTAPAAFMTKLLREATEFACLVRIAPPLGFEIAMRDRAVAGALTTEHVISADEFAYIADQPDRVRRWREYLESGVDVYRYDGDVPCNLFVIDEAVLVVDREPEVCAFIESEDETVRAWARDVIEEYRTDAERLRPGAFGDSRPVAAGQES